MKVHKLDELLILTLMQNLNKRRIKMREFQTYLKHQTYPSISITRSSVSSLPTPRLISLLLKGLPRTITPPVKKTHVVAFVLELA